jgi:hypothetical protein
VGFRFRKSIRVLPGIKLNFSRTGISTSVGTPGAMVNFSERGTRATVGLPGSGLSYSTLLSTNKDLATATNTSGGSGCLVAVVTVLAVVALAQCTNAERSSTGNSTNSTPQALMAQPVVPPTAETLFIIGRTVNCRANPDKKSPIVARLLHGAPGYRQSDPTVAGSRNPCSIEHPLRYPFPRRDERLWLDERHYQKVAVAPEGKSAPVHEGAGIASRLVATSGTAYDKNIVTAPHLPCP